MRRLRLRLLFQPKCSHSSGHPERTAGTADMPKRKGTGQRHARPARRILRLFREQRGGSSTGSQRRNRTGSNPHGISVFPAQHLPVFRISGTHRRLFLPLYGGRQQPGPCHGRCSRTVVDSHERIAPGRLRSGIREKRHRKAVGTMPLIPSPKGRLGACYSIYSKKLLYIRCNLSFFSTFAAEIL